MQQEVCQKRVTLKSASHAATHPATLHSESEPTQMDAQYEKHLFRSRLCLARGGEGRGRPHPWMVGACPLRVRLCTSLHGTSMAGHCHIGVLRLGGPGPGPRVRGHGRTERAPISAALPSALCALREHRNNVCPTAICGSAAASEMIESTWRAGVGYRVGVGVLVRTGLKSRRVGLG